MRAADLTPDDGRIAVEAAAPQRVAQDDHVRAVHAIVGRLKTSADDRRDAEHVEVAGADALAFQALGSIASGDRRPPRLEDRDRLEIVCALDVLAVHREGAVALRAVAVLLDDRDDAIRAGVRERREQERVHGAEDRGRAADPDREGHDRDEREAGRRGQAADAVPEIGEHRADGGFPAVRSDLVADAERAAQLEPRRAACVVRRQAAGPEVLGGGVEVLLYFVGSVLVRGAAVRERAPSARDLPPDRHNRYPSAFRGRWRAPAPGRRIQPAVSRWMTSVVCSTTPRR